MGDRAAGTLAGVTNAEGALPPDVAETLVAIQRLVNEAVERAGVPAVATGTGAGTATSVATGAGTAVPTGTGAGTVTFIGTAVGYAPPLTPDRVEALRAFVAQVRDGTIAVAVSVDVLEGLLSFAERVVDLLP